MKYAIAFKTSDGVTVRSEVMAFETDQEALAYTHAQGSKNAIVEAWKDDHLLARIEVPIRQIVENAGVEGSVVVENLRNFTDENFGCNAETEDYVDLYAAGIIDPVKVVPTALQDAASVVALIITTEALVTEASADGA